MGSGLGLALGAGYMTAGLAAATSDHHRAVRIAQAAGGDLTETMLQREIARMDPGAARLARGRDPGAEAAQGAAGGAWPIGAWPTGAWPTRPGLAGRRGSALQGARELDCLTEAVYFEARGETPKGQAAVAQVVMNRVANPNFPKTVCGVVFQGAAQKSVAGHGCQFSFACDGSMGHGLEADAWDRARRVAERALSGVVLADLRGATHFHALGVDPDWAPQMLRVAQVGLHVFYRFNPHAMALAGEGTPALPALSPPGSLGLAGAVLQKTSDVSAGAVAGALPAAPAAEAKAAPAAATDAAAVSKVSAPADSDR